MPPCLTIGADALRVWKETFWPIQLGRRQLIELLSYSVQGMASGPVARVSPVNPVLCSVAQRRGIQVGLDLFSLHLFSSATNTSN